MNKLPVAKAPWILVVNASNLHGEDEIMDVVRTYVKHPVIKSRNTTKNSLDLIIELRTEASNDLVCKVTELDFVESASLIAHDGEVTF